MSKKYDLTELARKDLKELWIYFAEYSDEFATIALREFSKKFQILADNSLIGRSRDSLILNLRSFPFKNHIIFYFPTENGVEIYRILHGSRDIEKLFDDIFEGLEP